MNHYRVAVIVGSLRRDSFNRRLARGVERLAPDHLSFHELEIGGLPLYNQDDDANPAGSVTQLKNEILGSDALLFVTPEYNRSIPGVLKNALDHASRPYGKSAWTGKPAGILGASSGAAGTCMAQQHLRNVLAYLDVPALAQPEAFIRVHEGLFDGNGGIADPDTRRFLQRWMERYVAWIQRFVSK